LERHPNNEIQNPNRGGTRDATKRCSCSHTPCTPLNSCECTPLNNCPHGDTPCTPPNNGAETRQRQPKKCDTSSASEAPSNQTKARCKLPSTGLPRCVCNRQPHDCLIPRHSRKSRTSPGNVKSITQKSNTRNHPPQQVPHPNTTRSSARRKPIPRSRNRTPTRPPTINPRTLRPSHRRNHQHRNQLPRRHPHSTQQSKLKQTPAKCVSQSASPSRSARSNVANPLRTANQPWHGPPPELHDERTSIANTRSN
jgi:hypothetical protein